MMANSLYLTVQSEGPRMRVIHLSMRLACMPHGWVSRDDLQADMPVLLHQLFATHPGIQRLYLGTHYVGFLIEEGVWTRHLEHQLIDIILDDRGLDHNAVTQVLYNYYKVVALSYVFALRDEKLFAVLV
jgi:hypothetical protein